MKEHATIELDTVIVAEIADGVVPESGSECEDVISVSLRRGNRRRCRPGGCHCHSAGENVISQGRVRADRGLIVCDARAATWNLSPEGMLPANGR
jgi:hypothetical protein